MVWTFMIFSTASREILGEKLLTQICLQNNFISAELCNRISTGSIKLLGRVGECQPPRVIMPLTIEPSKPRLCHDERYLNLWIKDSPFHLGTLKDVHRLVGKYALMITCDEKSGYDHVKLGESSQTYFGIQFGVFFMTYTTLPFGWKASPYVCQSLGMCATSYLRSLGLMNTLYIDDRFAVTKGGFVDSGNMKEAKKLSYVLLELLTRLGYTLSLKKMFICAFYLQAYILPLDKKQKFIELREFILSLKEVDLKTLQRFFGKCISMSLAVPGCKLFCREVNAAISFCTKNSRKVKVSGALRDELEYWKFIDSWSGCSKWRPEFHNRVELTTDSSGFRYGTLVGTGKDRIVLGDYWLYNDDWPIHEKEADAILKSLMSLGQSLLNSRVDVCTDNMAVICAWNS
ncbi:hypothetical protein KUTeg_005055 [Tegillarca granosa]|uniref:Reverse transcriptase domain-containing protein n=1 Tax=Tegillarca granosa TaxID=220873 RepID=A0ABQ9FIP0_TEGGR|nr:hypothetical protein KUTeg_005055 [Tegillarca granosa]